MVSCSADGLFGGRVIAVINVTDLDPGRDFSFQYLLAGLYFFRLVVLVQLLLYPHRCYTTLHYADCGVYRYCDATVSAAVIQ